MCYTIVFKNGNIQRLISISAFRVFNDYVTFYVEGSEKIFTYQRDRIASVVFYP